MPKLLSALTVAGALMLALSAAATAGGPHSNGATVINVDTCLPLIGGGTACIESKGVIQEVVTPSGNESYVSNYREHLLVIEDGQVVWDETSNERVHALTMDGVLQEMSSRSRFTLTTIGEPFCVQYHLHGTNGHDQFVRIDFC